MKTNKISAFVAMAALLMGMASCQKDERVLNLKFENIGGSNAKVYIDRDGQNRCIPMWQKGDVVRVNNTNITLGSTDGATASLLLPESVTNGFSGIVASYPASSGTTSASDCQSIRFSFPSTYTYNEVYKGGTLYQRVNVPMVGHIEDLEGSSSDMTMYNVCGMLRVNVTTDFDAFTVTSIIVLNEAGQSLNGSNDITFDDTDGKPIVNPKNGGSTSARTVTLNCGGKTVFGANAVGHSEADRMVSFYIPMMPVVNAKLKIKIVGYSNSNDGSAPQMVTLEKTQTENNTTIGRNQIKTAAITVSGSEVASEDIDQSVFSVSATKRVRILPGNVRYNSETNTWFVAPNAYDFVNTTSPDRNAIKDLFRCGFWWMDQIDMNNFYGTDVSHVVDANAKNYWTMDGDGTLTPHQSGLSGDWRLPTREEMNYWGNAARSNGPKYLRASIQTQSAPNGSANGMIIFPDQFAMPGGVPQIPFNLLNISVSTNNASNTSNAYYGYQPTLCEYYSLTTEQWGYLQNAGCVFFPFTGYGNNASSSSISAIGSTGYYHTTTPSATGLYIISYFSSSSYTTAAPNPYTRAAIRLVQDAN